jgi:hypothetical protein
MKQLLIPVVLLSISACSYNKIESTSCNGVDISFTKDVLPIVTASCATNSSCHATGSKEGPGALTSYAQVYASRNDVQSAVASGEMPQNSSLTSDQRNNIICWIKNGALDN